MQVSDPAGIDWGEEVIPERKYKIYRSADIMSKADPIVPLVNGVFSRGTVNILSAYGGIGKSFASIDLCLALISGTPWLAIHSVAHKPNMRCVYLDWESRINLFKMRVQALARGRGMT